MKFVVFLVLIVYLSGVSSAPYDSEYAIDENLRAENDALSTESSATTDPTNSDDISPGEDDPTNNLIPKFRKKIAANDGGKSSSGPGADSATDVEAPEGVDAPAAADQADPGAPADPGAAADPGAPVDKDTEQNGGAGSSVDTAASTEGQGGLGHAAPERVQVHGAAGGEHHSEPESTGANIAVTGNNRQQNTRAGSLQRLRNRLKGSLSFINPNSRVRAQGHGEVTAGANAANFETFSGQSDQPHGHDRTPDHGERNTLRGVGGISAGTPGDSGGSLSDWTSQSGSSLCSGGTNCGDNADVVGAMPVSPAIKRLISCPTCVIFPQGGENSNPFSFQGIMDQVNRKNQWMREHIILPFFSWGRPLFTKFVPQEQNWN